MPTYTIKYYDYNPNGNFPSSGVFTYTGPSSYAGEAVITDNQSGNDGAALDDDNRGENATTDITLGGVSYSGVDIDAEISWTLTDPSTGQEFNVVAAEVVTGGSSTWIMLSEAPLIAGTDYTVTSYNSIPDGGTDDPGFIYSFYEDGVIDGTSGDDTIDTSYEGDPEGEQVDDGILNGGVFRWNDLGNQVNYMGGTGSLTSEGMTLSFGVVDEGPGQIAYDPTNGGYDNNVYTESGEVFDPDSSFFLFGNRTGGAGTDTLTMNMAFSATDPSSGLSDEVRNVSFRVNDLDKVNGAFTDVLTIRAYDALGNEVPVDFDAGSAYSVSGNTVTGTAASNPYDASGSLLINITGPVASIVIDYNNTGTGTQGVWLSDVAFDAVYPDYDDVVDAGDGDDIIDAGLGDDIINAGNGDDTIIGGVGADQNNGGAGQDTIDYSGSDAGVNVDLALGTYSGGYAEGDTGSGLDGIIGSDFDDTLIGFDGMSTDPIAGYTNIFYGGDGNDYLDGAGGDDELYGDAGDDTILGGDGNDTIGGGTGEDNIDGGSGDDTIYGGAGNDTIDGGAGADNLYGGLGDDIITAGSGDTVVGGDGSDTVFIDPSQVGGSPITIDGEETNDSGMGDVLDLSLLGPGLYTPGSAVYSTPDQENGTITLSDGTVINFSNIETIICFGRGTRIETPYGPRPIESLKAGDLILTMDHGPQPLRWIGSREVPAVGTFAPIEFAAGALGNTEKLIVSQQHRMLMQDWRAQMLFDAEQVFTAAIHLENGDTIRRIEGGMVEYFHMMFDGHEVVFAEGAPSESLYPSAHTLGSVEAAAREELFHVFPELRAMPYADHPTARRCLKGYEAKLLIA
ncbi:Hint domain-containing protein [Celeribacter sp.]|uniref:Hint domain-containing protein n=1 Tax=Celeribacter sp. TaxID=1890673 RepID=UPI003A939344